MPPVRLRARGELVDDIWNLILCNTRTKDDITGDLNAMVGGCIIGETRLLEIVSKYGAAAVIRSVDYILDYSENRLRAAIRHGQTECTAAAVSSIMTMPAAATCRSRRQ